MSANVETMFSVRETPWHGRERPTNVRKEEIFREV